MPELGDAPIEAEFRETMNRLAQAIDEIFNGTKKGDERTVGFILMTFNFGDAGRCNYISNCMREDVVTLLKEQLRRFEGAPDVTGKA